MKTKFWPGISLVAVTTLAVLGVLALLAGTKKGAAERVGKKFDHGLDQAEDKVDDFLAMKGRFEGVGERLGERVDTLIDRAKHTFKTHEVG
jgi:hypothetical protein